MERKRNIFVVAGFLVRLMLRQDIGKTHIMFGVQTLDDCTCTLVLVTIVRKIELTNC